MGIQQLHHLPSPAQNSSLSDHQSQEMARVALIVLCLVAAASASGNNCYSCKSGGTANHQLTGCPPNGVMEGWAADNFVACDGPCASVIKANPVGNVVRGCAAIFNFQLDAIPTSGCQDVNGE